MPTHRKPSKPSSFDELTALTEAQKEEIARNEERYERYELTLQSVFDTIQQIGGEGRVTELLELREVTELAMVRDEGLRHTLRDELGGAWKTITENLKLDEEGQLILTFHELDQIVGRLSGPRTEIIRSYQRHAGKRFMGREEIIQSLRASRPLHALPEADARPFDRTREAHVYQATTIGKQLESSDQPPISQRRAEIGRDAVRKTLNSAQAKVGNITQSHLARTITYTQIVLASLIRVHAEASTTQNELENMFGQVDRNVSNESLEAIFEAFDFEERKQVMLELGAQLARHIEHTLKLMEQETGVDNILTQLIPGRKIARLKRKILERMPASPDRDHAVRVLELAMRRRQELSGMKQPTRALPPELKEKLGQIDLLEIEDKDQ